MDFKDINCIVPVNWYGVTCTMYLYYKAMRWFCGVSVSYTEPKKKN